MQSAIASAIDHIGLTKLANRFGYRPSAVQKWRDQCRLPHTELSGLTQYASAIAEMCDGQYTVDQLIEETRASWTANPPRKSGPKAKRRRR